MKVQIFTDGDRIAVLKRYKRKKGVKRYAQGDVSYYILNSNHSLEHKKDIENHKKWFIEQNWKEIITITKKQLPANVTAKVEEQGVSK